MMNDTLTGSAGRDRLTFNSISEKVDKITDFNVLDDTIGTSATTAAHRSIYDSVEGHLFLDRDGTGSTASVLITTLSRNLSMTSDDIYVFS